MRRHVLALLAVTGVLFTAACTSDMPSAPRRGGALSNRSPAYTLPGWKRTGLILSGQVTALNCTPANPSYGSAVIGSEGGNLIIGPNRLIVPPGALTAPVLISGTVAGKPFEVDLQPHGLQFKNAAGLILDATSCLDVPNIVYLIDQVTVSDSIEAVYSN